MPNRTRYAVVGLGGRSAMFTAAILKDFADRAELVGYCDINQTRMAYYNAKYARDLGARPVPTYTPDRFDHMIGERKPDCVIVTSIDRTHHRYIIRAMELGCDAITEKPMTIDAPKCQAILDCIKRTGRKLTVTFNYRYAPRNSRVKELLAGGVIGQVLSVHFEWLLDTNHGADYFRRWHRDKRNSGGLIVHKATHHFDLVNWWIDSVPQAVFGFGDLKFYGRENAEQRGQLRFYHRAHGSEYAKNDPFALHMEQHEELRELYLKAEHEDGYHRDQSVFGDNISIEDDMALLVRYRSGATMSYHLTAYSPWEGYRVAFNGTKGRLEMEVVEAGYVSGSDDDANRPDLRNAESLSQNPCGTGVSPAESGGFGMGCKELEAKASTRMVVRPHWSKPLEMPEITGQGGHGGADERLLRAIFGPAGDDPREDPSNRAASHIDGAYSILTGIAANKSFATGTPINIADLVTF